MKVPQSAVAGPRDAAGREVRVRAFGIEVNPGEMGFDAFVDGLSQERRSRGGSTVKAGCAK